MASMIVAIDQTASRASYGIKNQQQLLTDTVAEQRQKVRENIDGIVAAGNRMVRIASRENAIAEMAAEAYLNEPKKEVTLVPVDRPTFHTAEITGGRIDMFI